jgi:transposase
MYATALIPSREMATERTAWILRAAGRYWRVAQDELSGDAPDARHARQVALVLLAREGFSEMEAAAVLGVPVRAARQAQRAVVAHARLACAVETIGWTIPVLAQVSRHWGLAPRQVWGRSRQLPLPDARHVTMYLIHAAGPSVMEVARVFDRNHSSVVHAVRRVRASRILLREIDALRWVICPAGAPQQALVQALEEALVGVLLLSAVEREAIRAYVCGMLTHLEPFHTGAALAGLRLLAQRGTLIWAVRGALARCNLEGYLPHVRLHAHQLDPHLGQQWDRQLGA